MVLNPIDRLTGWIGAGPTGMPMDSISEHVMQEQAREIRQRIEQCHSYDAALNIIEDYVNITSVEQVEEIVFDSI